MPSKGSGGGTSFEDMSHEQMLQWLDQAKAGTVQAAADRLTAAAKEIRKIAEELKVRPQYVEWKGEGADAFRTWSGDLANATLRLGDFSEEAGEWLGRTSGAIATAQASIPRDTKGAQANLDAANAARNDPDAAAVSDKSRSELEALAADRERVRLEAAAQMRKLGQTYAWSAVQMEGLERPKFPPPPAAIKPPEDVRSEDLARPGTGSSSGASGGGTGSVGTVGVTPQRLETGPSASRVPSEDVRPSVTEPVTRVNIDSVSVLPEVHQPSPGPSGGGQVTGRPDTGAPPLTSGTTPPLSSGASRMPPSVTSGQGRTAFGGRMPAQPGQAVPGSAPGRGVTEAGPIQGRNIPGPGMASGNTAPGQGAASGRGVPANSGIVGGRPTTTPVTGRPTGRLPGGTVVGGEPASNSGSIGRVPTGPVGQPVAHPASPASGRFAPTPSHGGIVGGTPQQTGRAPARPGAPVPSAPTRGGISGGTPSEGSTRRSVRGGPAGPTSGVRQGNQRQQSGHRNEPPTAD
ncbi:translation initiation factor IF-2 [Streptomyces sp. SA15]|uniref:translation initiation factor IF-2 n=1 Tax=Streptomyces sp. SA15 TaxID=934019 RepID=UPI000BAEA1BA|nr:translation initiation factor IF-2 [Streptomyces sp. SA15]PAZ17489.1 translation initiation factor IF-2 [Streptomyces sp. SA15]